MAVTGDAEAGATAVKFSNWKDDGGFYPADTFYGVYKITTGYAHFYNFLELALAPQPITQLDQGLSGDGHAYVVGIQCMKKDKCGATKATPTAELTPAFEYEFGFTRFDEEVFLQ